MNYKDCIILNFKSRKRGDQAQKFVKNNENMPKTRMIWIYDNWFSVEKHFLSEENESDFWYILLDSSGSIPRKPMKMVENLNREKFN